MRVPRRPRLAVVALEDRAVPTAGVMDPSFGTGGKVKFHLNLPGFYSSDTRGVAVQPDGKTVLVGLADSTLGAQAIVYRLNTDGSLDNTFGSGGMAINEFGANDAYFEAVALQPDGKIVATGRIRPAGQYTTLTARFNPDGSLDPTFGTNGYVTSDFSSYEEDARGLAIQPDGKIVVVGDANGFMFLRYTPDGVLDPTFSLDGVFVHRPGGYQATGRGVVIQPDGKILGVGGGVEVGSPNKAMMLIRLNADGTFDTSFNQDGIVTTLYPGAGETGGWDVAARADGRILAVGQAVVGPFGQFFAARYLADGSLDTSFDTDGRVLYQFPPIEGGGFTSVGIDPGGKFVAAGYTAFPNDAVVVRFNENGSTDSTFGVGNYLLAPGLRVH